MATERDFAAKRLLRDFRDVLRAPVLNVAAAPVDDNLFVWHGNLSVDDGELAGISIHFVLVFPHTYPAVAPEVRFFHAMPHPNMVRVDTSAQAPGTSWRLALWDCVPAFDGWSCAYTVNSILVQLQAFLLDDDLQFADYKASAEDVKHWAAQINVHGQQCGCSHTAVRPWPALPDAAAVDAAPSRRFREVCIPPAAVDYRVPAHVHTALKRVQQAPTVVAAPRNDSEITSSSSGNDAPASAKVTSAGPEWPDWTVVRGGKKKHLHAENASRPANGAAAQSHHAASSGAAAANAFEVLASLPDNLSWQPAQPSEKKPKTVIQPLSSPQQKVSAGPKNGKVKAVAEINITVVVAASGPKAGTAPQQQAAEVPGLDEAAAAAGDANLSASARKRRNRALRKKAALALLSPGPPTPNEANDAQPLAAEVPAASSEASEDEIRIDGPGASSEASPPTAATAAPQCKDIVASLDLRADAKSLRSAIIDSVASEADAVERARARPVMLPNHRNAESALCPASIAAMGCFSALPSDALESIMVHMAPRDIAALGSTCRALCAAARNGHVWRDHLARLFPQAGQLEALQWADWRHAYLVEANNVAEQLRCYASKRSPLQDASVVLGMPLRFTINPKTKRVDYIEASPDLLSTDAFAAGVVKTPLKERVEALLPVYISPAHFAAAQPHLNAVLRLLAPEACIGGATPPATTWLDILPRIINTSITLLCAEGVSNSDAATTVLCHAHRLLLALASMNDLWGAAAARVHAFLTDHDARSKAACPSLGWFTPLLMLTPRYRLAHLLPVLLDEADTRSILWICKANPDAAKALARKHASKGDADVLKEAWQSLRVSTRLFMFHAAFLNLVACPPQRSLELVMHGYDLLYGMPSARVCERMRGAVRTIFAIDSWQGYHANLGASKWPGDAWMMAKLRRAWTASLRRGYHKERMDFSKIHKSGVSKILLKSNLYSAPPTLRRIRVVQHWRWRDNSGSQYLDSSCLAVSTEAGEGGDVRREVLGWIDFRNEKSEFTRVHGAMRHSGDIMNFGENSGRHEMDINLAEVGLRVSELYLTMSAWMSACLADFEQPFVTVEDPDSGMELCGYMLENEAREARRSASVVVMCRIFRGGGRWHVQALGDLGQGDASQMQALKETVLNVAARSSTS